MKYDAPEDIWEGLVVCPVHEDRADEDCDTCSAELTARQVILEQMMAEAADRMKGATALGAGEVPPWLLLEIRVETLIDTLFSDARHRYQFEGEVGRRTMQMVKRVQEQVKQPTLHVPSSVRNLRD